MGIEAGVREEMKSVKVILYNDAKKEQIDKLVENIKVHGQNVVFAIDISGLKQEEAKSK